MLRRGGAIRPAENRFQGRDGRAVMGKMIYNLDKRLEREIISLAKSFGVKKLILFGSRARGTNRERSDIDLAAAGGDVSNFAEAVDDKIDTLLSFDVVNLDDNLDDDFRAEIARDGIALYEETTPIMKKYEYFCKSLNNLVEGAKIEPPYSVLELTGLVALFEICFEQSWKMMKEILESHSFYPDKIASPRTIIKISYQYGMIDDEKTWLEIQNTRNILAHTYSEEDSLETVEKIKASYLETFLKLKAEVEKNWL